MGNGNRLSSIIGPTLLLQLFAFLWFLLWLSYLTFLLALTFGRAFAPSLSRFFLRINFFAFLKSRLVLFNGNFFFRDCRKFIKRWVFVRVFSHIILVLSSGQSLLSLFECSHQEDLSYSWDVIVVPVRPLTHNSFIVILQVHVRELRDRLQNLLVKGNRQRDTCCLDSPDHMSKLVLIVNAFLHYIYLLWVVLKCLTPDPAAAQHVPTK